MKPGLYDYYTDTKKIKLYEKWKRSNVAEYRIYVNTPVIIDGVKHYICGYIFNVKIKK